MNTTYKEQINAIQIARATLKKIAETLKMENPDIDAALNDAASTIAAKKWDEEREAGRIKKEEDEVNRLMKTGHKHLRW